MTTENDPRSSTLFGRVALITGSSHGIGETIAKFFAAHGAVVVVHGREQVAIDGVVRDITSTGGRAVGVKADVTDFGQIEAMRELIEAQVGPVDILVANAGGNTSRPGNLEDMSESEWRGALEGNLTAAFLTVKCFLPGMKSRGFGNVVTMSSAASRRPTVGSPVGYAAAKAGIEALTRFIAIQAGPFGVRSNCLAPETIMTERNKTQIPSQVQEQLIQNHPIRRLGTPEDVAAAALYLAGDESSWITGTILDIAGGSVLV